MTVGGGGDGSVSIEIDSKKPFDLGNIIKVKNIRVAAFPDFIMDWVARQTDEIVNKLFALPNLIIIPPTDLGPNASVDGSAKGYNDLFSNMAEKASLSELKSQMNGAFDKTNVADQFSKKLTANDTASSSF